MNKVEIKNQQGETEGWTVCVIEKNNFVSFYSFLDEEWSTYICTHDLATEEEAEHLIAEHLNQKNDE